MKVPGQQLPFILIVNSEQDLLERLRRSIARAFNTCAYTTYTRPALDDYPSMRVSKPPKFEIVLIDVYKWVENLNDTEVMERQIIPNWVNDLVADVDGNGGVIFLTPEDKIDSVNAHVLRNKSLRARSNVVAREEEVWKKEPMDLRRLLEGRSPEHHSINRNRWDRWSDKFGPGL